MIFKFLYPDIPDWYAGEIGCYQIGELVTFEYGKMKGTWMVKQIEHKFTHQENITIITLETA